MRLRLLASVVALFVLAGCGGLSPMLGSPDEAVTGHHLVVFVPGEMDVWGEGLFDSLLVGDEPLEHHVRAALQAELRGRLRFGQVDVQVLTDSLRLTGRRFRLLERRTETVRTVRLPADGTVVRIGGATPDYLLFLDGLRLGRLRPGPGAVLGIASSPAMAGGGWHGVEWEALGALWDNRTGAAVALAPARGAGAFENQTGVLDGGDPTAQTWADAVADLAERTAQALHLARRE